MTGGDYPSTDFHIVEEGGLRRVMHIPTGMTIESMRLPADPILVSSTYTVEFERDVARPGEVTQAALRHLRVWLMRRYGKDARPTKEVEPPPDGFGITLHMPPPDFRGSSNIMASQPKEADNHASPACYPSSGRNHPQHVRHHDIRIKSAAARPV